VPGDPDHPERTAIELSQRDGALIAGELEYRSDRTRAVIGVWRYTARFGDLLATQNSGVLVERDGNDGAYMFLERDLAHNGAEDAQGLAGWVRVGFADENFNQIAWYAGGGLVYTGPFYGRAEDQVGVAVGWAEYGDPYRRSRALAGAPSDAHEIVIEASYRAPLTPRLTLQPDIQYVINPGGDPALDDALVLGLRFEIAFSRALP
jgi:porin